MNGIYAIKPKFQQALRPAESLLIKAKIHPDWITGAALVISVSGGTALCLSSQPGFLWLLCSTPLVAISRTILNALDGMVAKDTGLARPWGEVLNEFSDRLSDLAIFAGTGMSKLCSGPLLMTALVSVLLSSYLGILAKAAGSKRQFGGIMGKADRMILLALAGPLAFFLSKSGICSASTVMNCFLYLVAAGAMITLVQRARRTYDDLQSAGQ